MQDRPLPPDQNPPRSVDAGSPDPADALESDNPADALNAADETNDNASDGASSPTRRIPFVSAAREGGGSPSAPRSRLSRDSSWFWPLANLIGLVAVVAVNWLANWLPLNDMKTGDIANRNPVPFQPAGWAFSIWTVIYVLLLVFVIYGLLPAGRRNARIQSVGPFFLVANVANIAWLFLWHWQKIGASLIVMAILLASLVAISAVIRLRGRNGVEPSVVQRLIVWTPFSVYTGWISVAILANVQIWMDRGGWDGGPFGLRAWAVIFLLAGVLVTAGVAFFFHDAAYTLVFVWAYLGIAQKQWDESKLVSITAILLVVVVAAITVMAFILAFDRRTTQGSPFALRRRTAPPPQI